MNEYSWSKGDKLCVNSVPNESMPGRVALTATGVVTKKGAGEALSSLLLCNPHPDSWNSWMLPYGSLAVEPDDLPPKIDFGKLAECMEDLRNREAGSYEAKALAQVKKTVGMPDCDFALEPRFSNYSLKFSKGANVWTAYCFAYHVSKNGEKANPQVQNIWLTLSDDAVSLVVAERKLEGLAVADNVLALLQNMNALNLLR